MGLIVAGVVNTIRHSMLVAGAVVGAAALVGLVVGIPLTAVIGVLMVSRFRYLSFKEVSPGRRLRFANLLLIPLAIIVIALEPAIVIFVTATAYAASAPIAFLWRHRRLKPAEVKLEPAILDEVEGLDEDSVEHEQALFDKNEK